MNSSLETVCFTMANFSVRVTTLVLSLSYLGPGWTLIFMVLVLVLNSLYFHFSSAIPSRFNTLSSWVMSLTTTTLVVENISMKERGRDTHRSDQEKKDIQNCLFQHSLLNLSVFASYGALISLLISFCPVLTDSNNILTDRQILDVYLKVLLPLTVINLSSCLTIRFLPSFSKAKFIQIMSTSFSVILFLSTIIVPITSAALWVSPSPKDVFVLVKVRDSLSIFTATTFSNFSWDIDQKWRYDIETDSLRHGHWRFSILQNIPEERVNWLSLSQNLSEADRNEFLNQGHIYITDQIIPVNWETDLFRYSSVNPREHFLSIKNKGP